MPFLAWDGATSFFISNKLCIARLRVRPVLDTLTPKEKEDITALLAFAMKSSIKSSIAVMSRPAQANNSAKQRIGLFVTALRRDITALSGWQELDFNLRKKLQATALSMDFWTDIGISRLTPTLPEKIGN